MLLKADTILPGVSNMAIVLLFAPGLCQVSYYWGMFTPHSRLSLHCELRRYTVIFITRVMLYCLAYMCHTRVRRGGQVLVSLLAVCPGECSSHLLNTLSTRPFLSPRGSLGREVQASWEEDVFSGARHTPPSPPPHLGDGHAYAQVSCSVYMPQIYQEGAKVRPSTGRQDTLCLK